MNPLKEQLRLDCQQNILVSLIGEKNPLNLLPLPEWKTHV